MKLLPAAVNAGGPLQAPEVSADVSTGLVPLTRRAITLQAGQASLAPSADTFAWSSSSQSSSSSPSGARRGEAPFIDATPVEDSPSHETNDETSEEAGSRWEYVPGWAWSGLVAGTAIAQYLLYAGSPVNWSERLINVYG